MDKKALIRKRYFHIRKTKYFEIDYKFFNPLIKLINNFKKKKKNISIYYPSFYEVNVLKFLDCPKKINFLLPLIEKNNSINFYKWKKNDILFLNEYGIPEPKKTKKINPDIIMVPLIAFDENKNRIGYGKGFYDKYLNKYKSINKNILTVGIAFSFQKYNKLPANNKDFKLDYIITEKGIF